MPSVSSNIIEALNSEKFFKLQQQLDNFVRQDSFGKQKEDPEFQAKFYHGERA